MQAATTPTHHFPPATAKRSLVAFRIGSQLFALETEEVRAALRTLPMTSVPMASPGLAGVAWYQEQMISVIDLRTLLGLSPRHESVKTAMLIVQHEGEHAALMVDKIEDVLEVTSNDFSPTPVTIESAWRQATDSVVQHPRGLIAILNVPGIFKTMAQ